MRSRTEQTGFMKSAECIVYLSCIYRISIVYLSCIYRVSIVYLSCIYRVCRLQGVCKWATKGLSFARKGLGA